jgi:uncharacterized protein YdbL (DUF1318 family)
MIVEIIKEFAAIMLVPVFLIVCLIGLTSILQWVLKPPKSIIDYQLHFERLHKTIDLLQRDAEINNRIIQRNNERNKYYQTLLKKNGIKFNPNPTQSDCYSVFKEAEPTKSDEA